MWFKKKNKEVKPKLPYTPETWIDISSGKRNYIRTVYRNVIRPKYSGKELMLALPEVMMDLIEAYDNYTEKETHNAK